MSFQDKVQDTHEISMCYQSGLSAIDRVNRAKFQCNDTRKIDGSVNIDSCVHNLYPSANRWDYVIGYDDRVYFVEIHPADTSEVTKIENKLIWLKSWIEGQSSPLIENATYHWVATGAVNITSNSPQSRKLAKMGISGPKRMCQCK